MKIVKLNVRNTEKIRRLLEDARKTSLKIVAKGIGMTLLSIIPIVAVSVYLDLASSPFPFVAGLVTAIVIQTRYISPKAKEMGARITAEAKAILEDQKDHDEA